MRGTRSAGWVCFLGAAFLAVGVERAEAQLTGACCDYLAEVCTVGVTQSTCESSGRQYRGHGTSCGNLLYPCGCDTECSECSVKQGAGSRHVEIKLISVSSSGGNTTFTYEICQAPSSQDLSHWVMGLSEDCCSRIVSATGGTEVGTSCGTDPTTGLFGLKWETDGGIPTCSGSTCNGGGALFTITLSGSVPTGCVKTVNKINGPPANAWGCVQGPVCQDCVEHADCDDGDVCNGVELCVGGECQTGTPLDCDDGDPCTTDTCDPEDGCQYTPKNCNDGVSCTVDTCDPDTGQCVHSADDSLCDDGLFCNGQEWCDPVNGCQAGTPPDCDDGIACTVDTCDEGLKQCVNTPVDSICDDGKYCTGVETCDPNLGCQAGTPVDCDDGVDCTVDKCDELTQSCVHTPNNALCDDGNPCNGLETCDPTLGCQAGTPPKCDDGLACTIDTCDPDTGQCVHTPDDSLCDDGVFCNGEEACSPLHGCVSGDPVECDDGVACTVDVCDEALEQCVNTPTDSACNDGNPCTINTCDPIEGCKTEPVVCDDGIPCTIDSCNPNTGQCVHTPDDSICDDGIYCNGAEVCDPALGCQAGTPVDCDDGVGCTVDACDEATQSCINTPDNGACDDGVACTVDVCDPINGCTNTADDSLCDDGNPCTINTCDPFGGCQTDPVVCDDGVPCTVDSCDPQTGQCVHTPDDSQCDDGVFCNGAETCDATLGCQAGVPVNCDDGVACTVDTCDEATQSCINTPDDSVCDDGLYCNGVETCDPNLGCQGGVPVGCDDGVACTIDTCDEATQSCIHTPDDGACDDGDPCTINTCDPVSGCATTPVVCDDGVPCTIDSCDPQTGQCVHTPDDSICEDGLYCNGNETCDPSLGCQAGTPVDCDDGVSCTIDSCDEATQGCINAPDDSVCDDGVYCNGAEWCDPVNDCQAGTPVVCDDGVACTVDTCDEASQSCVHTPDDSACDDGDPCTINTCDPFGGCQTDPVICDDGIPCTLDTCDPQTGQCVHTPDDSLCDDGVYCNGAEVCDPTLGCQAGVPIDCDDGIACTIDFCDEANNTCVNQPDDSVCDDGVSCTVDVCDPVLGCVNTPDDSLCDNGLFCDGQEFCDPSLDCQDGPNPCNAPLKCDENIDACVDCLTDDQCDDGLWCNGDEVCVGGVCQAGVPVDCDDGVACTVDTCDEATQSCINTPDESVCDDGVYCNGVETCDPNLGCQGGVPVGCDDGVACTIDTCDEATQSCIHTPDDGACDDGDPCTINTCDPVSGCATTPVDCDDGVPCTIDSCDPQTGQCVHTPDDSICDDGLYCNGNETCDPSLGCQAGTPVDCDDGVSCTIDSCDEATQSCINAPDDSVCDDGVYCNGDEWCDPVNDCQAGTPVDCDDGVACTVDTCDEASQSCVHTPNHGACDDGVACTVDVCDPVDGCVNTPDDSACDDGALCTDNTCDPVNGCQTTPVVCDDGVACTVDFCDPDTGQCVHQPDDSACDNGLWCDGAEVCDPLSGCQPGIAPDCDDGVSCTDDSCDEVNDTCVHVPNNANCDDGLFCNGVETCDPVNDCQPGSNPCPKDLLCDEANNTCIECFGDEDCDDGNFCNGFEVCVGGFCEPGTPPDCDDGIACTNCFCDPQINFCNCVPDDALCDDGSFCSGDETCDSVLGCQGGAPVNCDDGVACTVDSCDEVTESCIHTPDDSLCDDGDPCTVNTCDPVNGCQSTPVVCDDGIPCTIDSCDSVTGACVHEPDDTFCDNGLWCDGQEWCDPVNGCQPGTPVDCDDGIECTIDNCDEANDQCVHLPKHSVCDDGIHCNGIEMCDPEEGCVAGTPPVCDDGIECTNSFCDEDQAKCVHEPDDALCDDGVYCNGEEFCDPLFGCRDGTPVDCDDGIECTTDACDEATQSCTNTPQDSLCSDGQFCNGQEVCDPALGCQPGQPVVCDDGIECTVGTCDEVHDMCRFTSDNSLCDDGDPCTQGICQNGSGCTYTSLCGACCIFGGGCVDNVNAFGCELLGPSMFMGVGSTCTGSRGEIDDICPDMIPTMSEWGLVILTLLLLAGAKVSFGRRRVAAG